MTVKQIARFTDGSFINEIWDDVEHPYYPNPYLRVVHKYWEYKMSATETSLHKALDFLEWARSKEASE